MVVGNTDDEALKTAVCEVKGGGRRCVLDHMVATRSKARASEGGITILSFATNETAYLPALRGLRPRDLPTYLPTQLPPQTYRTTYLPDVTAKIAQKWNMSGGVRATRGLVQLSERKRGIHK